MMYGEARASGLPRLGTATSAFWQAVSRRLRPQASMVIPFLALIILVVLFSFLEPDRFLQMSNFQTIVRQSVVLAVVAFGMTFVIVSGSIDLSVGSLVGLTGVVAAMLSAEYGPLALLVAALVGAAAGAVNGLVFAFGKIPSFVVTLGMLQAARGLTIIISDGHPQAVVPTGFMADIGTEPGIYIVLAIASAVAIVLFRGTLFGRRVQAVGGNERVAALAGMPVRRIKVLVFVVSGFLAGVGGAVLASRTGAGTPTAGTGFELDVIAAVVIGGTPLTGGTGRITGTIVGALIISMLSNGLVLMGVADAPQLVIKGAVLAAAVFVSLDRSKIGVIK